MLKHCPLIVAFVLLINLFNCRAQAAVTCLAPEVNLRRKKVSNQWSKELLGSIHGWELRRVRWKISFVVGKLFLCWVQVQVAGLCAQYAQAIRQAGGAGLLAEVTSIVCFGESNWSSRKTQHLKKVFCSVFQRTNLEFKGIICMAGDRPGEGPEGCRS